MTKAFHSLHFSCELPVRTINPVGLPTLGMGFQHLVLNHHDILFDSIEIDQINSKDLFQIKTVGRNNFESVLPVEIYSSSGLIASYEGESGYIPRVMFDYSIFKYLDKSIFDNIHACKSSFTVPGSLNKDSGFRGRYSKSFQSKVYSVLLKRSVI